MAGEAENGASHESVDAPPDETELIRQLAIAREELGAAREALRWEREQRAQESEEHVIAAAQSAARAESDRMEAWDWCVRAGMYQQSEERIKGSRSYRLTAPLRSLAALAGGRRRRQTLNLPEVASPRVSLIIPIHAQAALTRSCLASIAAATPPIYEAVIVDDDADRESRRLLKTVRGARVLVNDENLGFLRSVNRAAESCDSEYLVVCNNDVRVHEGWLEALLDCAESAPDIGIVVPKFLQLDGTIGEAGGIVWSDAGGNAYARGRDIHFGPADYRREVDYGSGAAMLVRTDFWREAGGFDESFAPAYYEDTDLCFTARDRGLRVMYEPRARVTHFEGATHGTDVKEGVKAYQAVNQPRFAEKWKQALAEQPDSSDDWEDIRPAGDRAKGPEVLVIDHRVPSPDLDSGSSRMVGLIKGLLTVGCIVRFLPDDEYRWEPYTSNLQRLGVEVLYGYRLVRDELSMFGSDLDLVVVSRPQTARMLPLIRELAPQARLAYDSVDLHFLRERRRGVLESDGDAPSVAAAYHALETAMFKACDVTICVSEEEAELVREEVPGTTTEVISNVHEVVSAAAPLDSRRDLLFVGSYVHPPNPDAAHFLAEEVMPSVLERLPDAKAAIVGSHMGDDVKALASDALDVEGWVEDMDARLDRARVMIAPLRYGAGVKGKITLSLARGLPVVTTPVGAEGLGATPGENILIAEDADGLAREAVRLLTDDELWRTISAGGLTLAASKFSTDCVDETLRAMLPARS